MDNRKKIREFTLSSMKRMSYELEFLTSTLLQNIRAFDDAKYAAYCLQQAIDQIDNVIRDEFTKEEVDTVEMTPPYQLVQKPEA